MPSILDRLQRMCPSIRTLSRALVVLSVLAVCGCDRGADDDGGESDDVSEQTPNDQGRAADPESGDDADPADAAPSARARRSCDAAELEALAGRVKAASPGDALRTAADGVLAACPALPSELVVQLEAWRVQKPSPRSGADQQKGQLGTLRAPSGFGGPRPGGGGGKAGRGARRQVVVKGKLDEKIVRKAVAQHNQEVRYCHRRELSKDPHLEGEIVVKFVIDPDGLVATAAVVESSMNNAMVERCLAGKIKRWRFPKPKGGDIVVVSYPFEFRLD